MTVDQILTFGCNNAGTTTEQVGTANALIYANTVYHELEEIIRNEIDEDYFYDYFTADTKYQQSEYNFSSIVPTATVPGILKIVSVGVKYTSSDTEYRTVRAFGSGSLYDTPEYTQVNQPDSDPFYIYKDNSIFLYPYPGNDGNDSLVAGDTVIVGGLRVHCSVSLIDLVSGGAETTVKIPRNFHYVIGLGMKKYIAGYRSLDGTAKTGLDLYEQGKKALTDYLRNRTITPVEQDLPVLTNIMY